MEDILRRLEVRVAELEARQNIARPHALTHELAGGDTVRLSVQNGGTQLNRHRTLNAGTGLTATEDSANQRITLATSLADESVTSRMWAPVVIEQRCTTTTTIASATPADITGATISVTPAIASMALVIGIFDVNVGTASDVYLGILDVDGVDEIANAAIRGEATALATVSQIWVFPLTAASHTIKLQCARSSGTGTGTFYSPHTKLVLILMGDANVTNDTSS